MKTYNNNLQQNKERKADQNYKTILLHSAQFTTYWAIKEITPTTKLSLNYYIPHYFQNMCYYLLSPWPQGIPIPALEHNWSRKPAFPIFHLNFNQILGILEKELELIF